MVLNQAEQQIGSDWRLMPDSAVAEEMARIEKSSAFRRCGRLWNILQYAVSLKLNDGVVSERAAGSKLSKGDFNPTLDPSVRVLFGRLRKRLDLYYQSEGKNDALRISIPPRSYTPMFFLHAADGKRPDDVPADRKAAGKTPASDKPSLAVLPFLNLTNDAEMDVYCAGVTDEVINALVAVPHLDVVARTSTFQFRDERVDVRTVGAELGADLILEGSIKVEGDHTRITSQLADAKDGFALWSGSYSGSGLVGEGELSQASIAERIVDSLPFPAEEGDCSSKKAREEA